MSPVVFPSSDLKTTYFTNNNCNKTLLVIDILAILFTIASFVFLGISFSSTVFCLSIIFLSVSFLALLLSLVSFIFLMKNCNFDSLELKSLNLFQDFLLTKKHELLALEKNLENRTNKKIGKEESLLTIQKQFDKECRSETSFSMDSYLAGLEKEREKRYLQSQLSYLDKEIGELQKEIRVFEEKIFSLKNNQSHRCEEKGRENEIILENCEAKAAIKNLSLDLNKLREELRSLTFQVNCKKKQYRSLVNNKLELYERSIRFYKDAQTTTVEEMQPVLPMKFLNFVEETDVFYNSSCDFSNEPDVKEVYEDQGECVSQQVCFACLSIQRKRLLRARKEEIAQFVEKCSKCEKN